MNALSPLPWPRVSSPDIRHKPKRLQVRKKPVTIALGAIARDGIVICADSQYTSAYKTEGDKVFLWTGRNAAVIFALSGDVATATMAIQECQDTLGSYRAKLTGDSIKKIIKTVIRGVQQEYVDKRPTPEERENAGFQLIVGIAAKNEQPAVYYTSDTGALTKFYEYCAVGSGTGLAEIVMEKIYHRNMEINDLIMLSTVAIATAKRHDAYCGGTAQFMTVKGARVSPIVPFDIGSIEDAMFNYEREALQIFLAAGDSTLSKKALSDRILDFKMRAENMRQSFSEKGTPYRDLIQSLEKPKL